jgi:predicted RNase H-like HicB family nuclease
MLKKFIVLIEKDDDGILVAKVPDIPGCHTQAKTMPQLLTRVKEAVSLCLEVKKMKHESIKETEFVGVQQIELAV